MTISPVRVERRVGQRFSYLLPVSIRQPSTGLESLGFTQDLSSRGVFFFTDAPLSVGSDVELTLRMPSEITLGETMPVRCRGRILRVVRPAVDSSHTETKIGVAVRLEGYEYLNSSAEKSIPVSRVATLHGRHDEDLPAAHPSSGR